ncbi:MAG: hypothetical protein GY807_19200 [Gammaproteobacteria bacterium]|nr:hypothetical protein [Gammaproteobacteria bacterium]
MNILHIHKAHVLSLLMITGCASTGVDLVAKGEVKVEHVPSHYAHIHRISVRQEQEMLIILGELHERSHHAGFVPGHVDIEVISLDGDVLQTGYTRYHRFGRSKSGKFKFSIQFPGTISQGSRIRVVHHPVSLQQEPRILRHPDP